MQSDKIPNKVTEAFMTIGIIEVVVIGGIVLIALLLLLKYAFHTMKAMDEQKHEEFENEIEKENLQI